MRILAIRGAGIASLAAEFEVRLDAAPLAGAGVFAIVGPTGAGKSTLLDALFLALFGRTPRLSGAERQRVLATESDDEALSPRDARVLVRSDVDTAHAEVDFEGVDGGRYRARWAVQRKKRGAGTFRRPEHALLALGGDEAGSAAAQRLGGTKTEVLGLIASRLGLDFDQLRRSVVLAQGEIAAFLHADAQVRAELLERMTGTEIYGAVSRRLHAEAVRHEAQREVLAAELASTAILPAADRDALDRELARRAEDVREAEHRHDATLARARRALELAERVRDRDAALARAREVEAALDALAPRQADVTARRALLPLAPRLAELDRLASERARLDDEERTGRAAADAKQRALQGVEREREDARLALGTARDALTAARADESRASMAHVAASAEARGGEAARRAYADAEQALVQAEAQVAELEATWAHLDAAAERWRRRLAADPGLPATLERLGASSEHDPAEDHAVVSAITERAATLLARREEQEAERRAAEGQLADLERAVEDARREVQRAEGALAEARQRSSDSTEPWRLAVRRAEELVGAAEEPSDAARSDAGGLRAAIRHAEAACALTLRGIEAAIERRRIEAEAAERARDVDARRAAAWQDDLSRLSAELDQACAALEAAREARRDTETAKEVEREGHALAALRRGLRPGAPCAVCGQPVVIPPETRPPPPCDAEDRWRAAQHREHGLAVRVQTLQHLLHALDRDGAAAEAPRAHRPTPDEAQAEGDAGPRLAAERAALAARARALEAARRELEERLGDRLSAERALLDAEREASRCAAGLAETERAREHVRVQATEPARHRPDGRPDDEGLDAIASHAEGPLLPWLGTLVGEWLAARRAERDRPLLAARLEHGRERVQAGRLGLREGAERAARARAADEAEREAARAEASARTLVGTRTEDAERAEAQLTARTVAAERARAEAEAAERESARLAMLVPRRTAEHAALFAELAAACAGALADEAEGAARIERARALLGPVGEELDRLAIEFERLERDRHAALAVLDERRRQLASGEDGGSSEAALLAEHARLEAARHLEAEALGQARSACARLAERRLLDDDARARHASRREALAEHDAKLAVWRDLNDALGSADGKKLRVHAQRLTLALLVREASRHLADLAPRYAIELAPSELSLHVIDRSMGGEVRTTTALSGGETFVVSLALALGLAGLASRRMRLGTLFVDEGFGSLDAASLEVVLGALDALEATGRQIGIVSHVPELEERFAARVEVRPEGHGKSRVVVVG